MVIPKHVCWNGKFLMGLMALILLPLSTPSQADDSRAASQLARSYQLETPLDPDRIHALIGDLDLVLVACSDPYLANRIEYRIGVLHFKMKQFSFARERFEHLLARPESSLLIRVAGRNMLAQSLRLQGQDRLALESFAKLINVLEENFPPTRQNHPAAILSQLWVSALLARAEIFQTQQNLEPSEREYQKLITLFSRPAIQPLDPLLPAQVLDRCAQVDFQLGRLDRTLDLMDQIAQHFPRYGRLPLIRFEAEGIRFGQANALPIHFRGGLATLAVQIIGAIKRDKKNIDPAPLLDTLETLTNEYAHNPWNALLIYHYGWLRDALGQSHEAAQLFARLGTMEISDKDRDRPTPKTFATLRAYAKIHHAIILSEQAQYVQAVKILETLSDFSKPSHVARLADAVEKNIKILKREVHHREIAQ